MIRLVSFKSWEDFALLLKNHAIASCYNCIGWNGSIDKGQFVCMRTVSPIRLDMIHICAEWTDNDGQKLDDLGDIDWNWTFSKATGDKIEELGYASYDEMLEVINEEFEKQESAEKDC